jgi:hypothetical protein
MPERSKEWARTLAVTPLDFHAASICFLRMYRNQTAPMACVLHVFPVSTLRRRLDERTTRRVFPEDWHLSGR